MKEPIACLAVILLACTFSVAESKRTNIVLLMADDMGMEAIGAHGGESYRTPHIDKLANEGVRFDNCFANPLCTPSRTKIMTGQYNVRNYEKFGRLPRREKTFAHALKDAGYATAIAGKWQLGSEKDAPQHFGFDEAFLWYHIGNGRHEGGIDGRFVNPVVAINGEPKHFRDGEYGPQKCTDFICDFMERNRKHPFLVYYPMILTHCPFDPTPDSSDWDPKRAGSKTYKGPGTKADQQRHFGDMVNYADKIVGQLVAKLDALGLRNNTLIIFTGDNGTDKPIVSQWNGRTVVGGKGKMDDTGTRVPCVVSWPISMKGGRVSDQLVDFTDVFPTLCEAAGVELPEAYSGDGVSLLPVIRGEGNRSKPWVYVWYAGKTFARNHAYCVGGTHGKTSYTLTDVRKPFAPQPVANLKRNAEQNKNYQELLGVIQRLEKTRGNKPVPKR